MAQITMNELLEFALEQKASDIQHQQIQER